MARDEEVLRRRARFVATALALAGCTKEKPPSAEPVPTHEGKPTASTSTTTTSTAPSPGVPAPADRPPRTAKVSPAGKAELDKLVKRIEALHDDLAKTAAALPPKCDLADKTCLATVRAYVLKLGDHRDAIPDAPRCPPKGADAIAIEALRADHAAWFGKWLGAIDARLDALYAGSADAGGVLSGLRAEAVEAHPQPCLKYSCPP